MIEFSKIDGELSIYKSNQVFLFGASSAGIRVKTILENFGISIKAFVDNSIEKQGRYLENVEIISFSALRDMALENQKYIIQIASVYEKEIARQLEEKNLKYISYSEFSLRIRMLSEHLLFMENSKLRDYMYEIEWRREAAAVELCMREYFIKKQMGFSKSDTINFMLSAPKTGNNSIKASVQSSELMIAIHSFALLKEFLDRYASNFKMNIIIGIRDVISQNLSFLFEAMDDGYLNEVDFIWKNDVSAVFERCILSDKEDSLLRFMKEKIGTSYLVQEFFDQQINHFLGIDIYQYPFNKMKGYSIYDFGNLHIMIYQLEKLDVLEHELGEFLNLDGFMLKKANIGEEKWYSKYYKNVCKEMQFDDGYLEDCYSGKYMKHFYSEGDIANFRRKWKSNSRG